MTGEVREGFQAPQERTLRDEFAMSALTAILSCLGRKRIESSGKSEAQDYSRGAYALADAMMEARK